MASQSNYKNYVASLSPETLGCLREHLEKKYERNDFDLLEWADHTEIAEFVYDGFLEGVPKLEKWGKTFEIAAVNIMEAYLNEDKYTKTSLRCLIKRLNQFQREKLEELDHEKDEN